MRNKIAVLITAGVIALLAVPTPATATAECEFILGFAALKALIDEAEGPEKVGECLENQRFNPENGDALQQTTGGLLVWRKADNWTAFTDGYRTWINGPYGLQSRLNTEQFRWEVQIKISGYGQDVTETVDLPDGVWWAGIVHTGDSNFIVEVHRGGERAELLVNEIGDYSGIRPFWGGEPAVFSVEAGGLWSIIIRSLLCCVSEDFSGEGDNVSFLFHPQTTGAWEVKHNGDSNFIVTLHCRGGRELVQNKIGIVRGSTYISFPEGPCFWEVEADGEWSLRPRS